jgi:hypothetical protein
MSKYIWLWSSDGTVLYVKRVYQTRFLKRWRMQQVAWYSTDRFADVIVVAETLIKRLES